MNTLIVAGGEINLAFLENYYLSKKPGIIIAVDKGLDTLNKLNILPNHIVGDLDSVNQSLIESNKNNPKINIHQYQPEKDYTDTDIALKLAISLHSSHIAIIGALGKRMDHALANIHILTLALDANIPCEILDANNLIYLVNNAHTIEKSTTNGKYISLIPLTSKVEGLTLTGFKYPLNNYSLSIGKSLGISNEIIDDTATIFLKKGILIVIESRD